MSQLATVHGLMLSAWGIAGLFGNQLAAFIMRNHSLDVLYWVLGVLFVIELTVLVIWAKIVLPRQKESKMRAAASYLTGVIK
jgi:hypothetical protein